MSVQLRNISTYRKSEAASSLRLGSTELLERDEDLGDLTELRLENMEMTVVGDDLSGEETKCFRVASQASEDSCEEEEDLDLMAERNMELRACVQAGEASRVLQAVTVRA